MEHECYKTKEDLVLTKTNAVLPETFAPIPDLVPQAIETIRKITDKAGSYFSKTFLDSRAMPEAMIKQSA